VEGEKRKHGSSGECGGGSSGGAASAAAEAVAARRERNATAAEAMEPSKCRAKPIKNESNMKSESHWSSMQLLGAMEIRE